MGVEAADGLFLTASMLLAGAGSKGKGVRNRSGKERMWSPRQAVRGAGRDTKAGQGQSGVKMEAVGDLL